MTIWVYIVGGFGSAVIDPKAARHQRQASKRASLSASISDINLSVTTTMDSQATSRALHNRINTDVTQLLQRFENILAPSRVETPDNTYTAVGAYNLNVEATALTRAAEDLLSLTRFMKEAWLFEKLNTVGEDEHDLRRNQALEEDVAAVKEAVRTGLGREST
ncbi:hypothetical protein UA08_03611 [Talaromyces atroroseus]|uniref:Mediator of RNA polymerase II transcription subunit 22 n=1 Tax=Talaromyces atroroseus TaxID=1441469 RepID=A0A225AWC8_TALAT|nr:hypothetical protein UA08_03611 [Talaromyces atroroseus]OKL61618.1 hypothetical protein UA08_03611 [Talaromyces atroroseus]